MLKRGKLCVTKKNETRIYEKYSYEKKVEKVMEKHKKERAIKGNYPNKKYIQMVFTKNLFLLKNLLLD